MSNYSISGVCYNKYEIPLAEKIKDAVDEWGTKKDFEQQWYIADDDNPNPETFNRVQGPVRDWSVERSKDSDIIIYIAPVVRVVRYMAPVMVDQSSDPAVIAVDPNGRHCVPVISGRRGEAFEVARILDSRLSIEFVNPVMPDEARDFDITRYADQNCLVISNTDYATEVSTAIHSGGEVGFNTIYPVFGKLPGGMKHQSEGELGVYISHSYHEAYFKHTLWLIPKCVAIGIVCREYVPCKRIERFVSDTLKDYSIYPEAIMRVATVSSSRSVDEIEKLGKLYGVDVMTVSERSAEAYRKIKNSDMEDSELAALRCGGDRVFVKTLEEDGMCITIAIKELYVRF